MKNTDTETIYFDLDGTVYDLYGQDAWLRRITTEKDASVYANPHATLVDMVRLQEILLALMDKGYAIGVISWLAAGSPKRGGGFNPSTNEFKCAARSAKKWFIRNFLPMATEVHIVQYGTPKHTVANTAGILVDDSPEVREAWNKGIAIDATQNLIAQLERLVQEV